MPSRPLDPRRALAALLLLTAHLAAQPAGDEPAGTPAEARAAAIRNEGLLRGRSYEMLAGLCDAAPHRLAGSPGAAAAVEWARQTMTGIGLENVRLEPCIVPHWRRGAPESLRVVEPGEAAGDELAVLALGGSIATPPGGVTGEVVEVKSFEELEALGDAAAGKIVLFNRPMDPTSPDTFSAYGGAVNQRAQGAIHAGRAGAVASLVRSMTTRIDDNPHTGGMGYTVDVPRIPHAAVSTKAADWISTSLAAGKRVILNLQLFCETGPDEPSANVVGELRGAELPDEIVLIGGHLDAWDVGQGAHDDGSGIAQCLEAVRLLSTLGLRPRRTIRVVCFMNEENGTRGARAYARDHADELAQHVFALESDRGGFTPRGFTSDAGPEALPILRSLVAPLEPIGADRVVEGGGGVDISFLGRAGVVLAGYLPDSSRYFDFHHSPADRLEGVNPRELEMGAIAIATLAYEVANLEAALPRNAGR